MFIQSRYLVSTFLWSWQQKVYITPVCAYFALEKIKRRMHKAEDIAACQKCYNHSANDKGGNTSNLLSHLKINHPNLHELNLLSQSDSILSGLCKFNLCITQLQSAVYHDKLFVTNTDKQILILLSTNC